LFLSVVPLQTKCGDFSPFDYAQGQNDGFKHTTAKTTATAIGKNGLGEFVRSHPSLSAAKDGHSCVCGWFGCGCLGWFRCGNRKAILLFAEDLGLFVEVDTEGEALD
jgi:hypothetical protein